MDEPRSVAVAPRPGRTPIAPLSRPSSRANSNASSTNSPLSRWSGRTSLGRRCKDLYKAYWKQAGSPADAALCAGIMALSEQTVISELARSECLAPGGMTKINLELVVRTENLANRTMRRLSLGKPVSSKRTGPSLEDIKAKYAKPATDETSK
jgi:hypothetical protein